MATEEIKYLGQEATEQLIQNTKTIAAQKVAEHNINSDAHADIRELIGDAVAVVAQKTQVQFITWEADD